MTPTTSSYNHTRTTSKRSISLSGFTLPFSSAENNMAEEIVHHDRSGKTTQSESATTCDTTRKMKVRFSLTMLSEDLETEGLQELPNLELEDIDDIDDDCFADDSPLLIPLGTMSFDLDDEVDSVDFCSSDHQLNEIVVMPEQADFVCNAGKIGKVTMAETHLFLKPDQHSKFVATSRTNQISLKDEMSAKITIFHVRVYDDVKGKPVVLNFTDTSNFIRCTDQGGERILTFVEYDKQKLHNCADDEVKPSLIFYMSEDSGQFKFESLLHRGWFIHTVDGQVIKMQKDEVTANNRFKKIESESTKIVPYDSSD